MSTAKRLCKTSSIFEIANIKNEAFLRDFVQKLIVECRADGLLPLRWAIFPFHLSKVLRIPQKKWGQVIRSAAPVTQIHVSRPEDPMLQSATHLRNSKPPPPNMSDSCVSGTAPRNASLQIPLKCPIPANVFELLQKPHVLVSFGKVQNLLRMPR